MKAKYDLSNMRAGKNPYATKLKKSVTMRLSEDVIGYFKKTADESGVLDQSIINVYLRDCVASHRKVDISWRQELRKTHNRFTDYLNAILIRQAPS